MTSYLMNAKADPYSALDELAAVVRLIGDSLEPRRGDWVVGDDDVFSIDGLRGRRIVADETATALRQIADMKIAPDDKPGVGFFEWEDCLPTRLSELAYVAAFVGDFSRHRRQVDPNDESDIGIAALMDAVSDQLNWLSERAAPDMTPGRFSVVIREPEAKREAA